MPAAVLAPPAATAFAAPARAIITLDENKVAAVQHTKGTIEKYVATQTAAGQKELDALKRDLHDKYVDKRTE